MIYKFRVILDHKDDIFRDIAIENETTLEDLHNAIINSFGFDGSEVGSFYTCDDQWEQEDEIPLFDTGDTPGLQKIMSDFNLNEVLDTDKTKIIYLYDFLNMWTFFVELASIEEKQADLTYPTTLFSIGNIPDTNDFDLSNDSFEADEDELYYDGEYDEDIEESDNYDYNDDTWN